MVKKDQSDKIDPTSTMTLDKDSRKRFEKLTKDWTKNSGVLIGGFTSGDLRLLLEHHGPLQDLIRAICGIAQGDSASPVALQKCSLNEQSKTININHQNVAAELAEAEAEELRRKCQALHQDLKQCSDAAEKLLQEKNNFQERLGRREKELQQAQKELVAAHNELDRIGTFPAELRLLHDDAELARRLELADLPNDDTQALIQIVAVLAQRDNMERLWEALKERCEAQNRPVLKPERDLLAAALSWYNYNWRNKPYQLVEVASGATYDFDRHQRSQHTTSGEKIDELRLPGIADGSGRLSRKALISTR